MRRIEGQRGEVEKKKSRKMRVKTNFPGFAALPRACLIYLQQGCDQKKLGAEVFLSCSCTHKPHLA